VIKLKLEYPFKPKTNSYLRPGQFWAIPLSSGQYACGRVIELMPNGEIGSRTSFLAGLMDWVGENPPVAEDLIGCKTIKQGSVHIKTIHETGLDGMILGHRPLELEEIEPDNFRTQEGFEGCLLMKGYKEVRHISEEEWKKYGTLSIWGYEVIKILAEECFVTKKKE
jgi:Immunity protein 26